MRRVHLQELRPGPITPDAAQARHLRQVLRLSPGDRVEAFDASGQTAVAVVEAVEPAVVLRVESVTAAPAGQFTLTVASAVPKGDRADWMVEKLSELGIARFVPLRTARSVVHPEGRGKLERWERLAIESAKQCRRTGVLAISPLTDLAAFLGTVDPKTSIFCSTNPAARPLSSQALSPKPQALLIGPEGDWSPEEEADFAARGLTAVSLGRTILRVETAAVVAAGLVALLGASA